MRIYSDHKTGLAVNAISRRADGTNVAGNHFDVLTSHGSFTVYFQNGSPRSTVATA